MDRFDITARATIRVVDLETTGLDANDEVIEIGAVDLDIHSGEIRDAVSQIIRSGKSIPPQASAIHHITDVDVAEAPSWPTVWPQVFAAAPHVVAYAAHNASFDCRWITADLVGGKPVVCTYKAALRVWPDAPSHNNQVLRYWLNLPVDRDRAVPSHRALPDAYVTAHVLCELLKNATLEDLISWSTQPALLTTVHFGKHRGLKWTDVPDDYLRWIINTGDFDENVIYTAQTVRAGRATSRVA